MQGVVVIPGLAACVKLYFVVEKLSNFENDYLHEQGVAGAH